MVIGLGLWSLVVGRGLWSLVVDHGLWSLVMVIILLLVIGMVRNSMVAIAIVMMVV